MANSEWISKQVSANNQLIKKKSSTQLKEQHNFNRIIKLHFTFCKHAPD